MTLTQEYLQSIMRYDPETGVFTWRERKDVNVQWNARHPGKEVGWLHRPGKRLYKMTTINGRKYLVHRLVWLHLTGEWPNGQVDHIDGNGLNNRFSNLRVVTQSENMRNTQAYSSSRSGVKGVHKHSTNDKYVAQICRRGKRVHLGSFDTIEEAREAYEEADRKLAGLEKRRKE